jgi:hypothetical protein
MNEMGVELQELVLEVLELAVGCFSEGEQNPFVIFHDRAGKSRLLSDLHQERSDSKPFWA